MKKIAKSKWQTNMHGILRQFFVESSRSIFTFEHLYCKPFYELIQAVKKHKSKGFFFILICKILISWIIGTMVSNIVRK